MKTFLIILFVSLAVAIPRNRPSFRRGQLRIIGGTDASYGEFPYTVSLQDDSFGFLFHFCGGVIYSENTVLTAAHCVYSETPVDPSYIKAVAGDQTLYVPDGFEQTIKVASLLIQPNFNQYSMSSDLAILTLAKPLVFDDYVQAIAMPTKREESSGDCILSGWGVLEENGSPSPVLQKATLPFVSDVDCRAVYGVPDIEDSMMCAGGEAGIGGCQGDSGSPLVCIDSLGAPYLAGIGSYGYGCGKPGYPGVFAQVSYFTDWITNNAT